MTDIAPSAGALQQAMERALARETETGRQPGHLIRRAQQVHSFLWAAEVSATVTSTQFAVLSIIARQPQIDQNALAKLASLDTSTVADVVNRLSNRGYVARNKGTADRRRNLLTLTAEGERLFVRLSEAAERVGQRLVEALPEADRGDLVRILQLLVKAGEAMRAGDTVAGG